MTTHLGLQRILLPTAQVSSLTTGSITLPSARGAYEESEYYALATATSTGSATYFDFTSIPSGYRHLEVRGYGYRNDGSSYNNVGVRMNGDSGSTKYRWQFGVNNANSSNAASSTGDNVGPTVQSWSGTTNQMGVAIFFFEDYTNTSHHKTFYSFGGASENGSTTGETSIGVGTYADTAAITSLRFLNSSTVTYANGSKFVLYGIGRV